MHGIYQEYSMYIHEIGVSDDKRQRLLFKLTGESDNNSRREAGVSAGGQKAFRTRTAPGWPCTGR
jgi:hypothetical protein